jgi:hypothetical protein
VLANRGRASRVLVALLVNKSLQVFVRHLGLIEQDVVVHRARCSLKSLVCAEIEIVLERTRHTGLDECSLFKQRI